MNIKIKIIFTTIFISFIFAPFSFAQEKVLDKIKKTMTDLAQKNYELKRRYEEKMKEVSALEQKVEAKRKEVAVFEERQEKRNRSIQARKNSLKYFYKKMDIIQSDILIKKGKIPFLKKQLLEKQKDFDLLNLRLTDLKIQKKELQSKLNDDNFTSEKTEKQLSNKIITLKMKLSTNIEKQKKIADLIIAIEENVLSSAKKKQEVARENEKLQGMIEEMKKKTDIQKRKNLLLSDKLLLAQKSIEGDISLLTTERDQLVETVKAMETEYNDLTQKIEEALKWKTKKLRYQQDMVTLDKENADLRKKISELRNKRDSFKR